MSPAMILEQTITWLEMRSPEELRPGREPPAPVELLAVDRSQLPLVRTTNRRVGEPHGWSSRPAWSDARWAEHLARPGVRAWVARVGGEPAGVIELEARPEGEVEITVFGLVPEFVGRGFGGKGGLKGALPDGAFGKPMDDKAVLAAVKPFLASARPRR